MTNHGIRPEPSAGISSSMLDIFSGALDAEELSMHISGPPVHETDMVWYISSRANSFVVMVRTTIIQGTLRCIRNELLLLRHGTDA
ncbi:hypothetical protein EVAR_5028_1 [Eumeta japonica]|uniref:Uncharacterized protein n=1 Tax=Eumeta variegata TaxID=151549 RepID=A0A4C1STX5_EUMVA|nr:hypothetical protein EVAR_5028_1 [Eumeta japonica]